MNFNTIHSHFPTSHLPPHAALVSLSIFKSRNGRDFKIAPKRSLWSVCPHPLTGSRGFWLFNPIIWGRVWRLLRDYSLFVASEDQTSGCIQTAVVRFSFPASDWIIARQYFSVSLFFLYSCEFILASDVGGSRGCLHQKHTRLATDSFTHTQIVLILMHGAVNKATYLKH